MSGRFYGVGLGPGDPELLTLKAARLIASADVIAYHAGVGKQSNARRTAAHLIPADAVEEELRYPVTTGTADHPGGYTGAMADFYEQSAARLAHHLENDRDVVLLAEGDPLFYGSFMYMHDRLAERFETEIVPGVTSFSAATAAVASPLVRQTDVLTILPATLPEPELARRLADTDGAIVMKLGKRTFPGVRRALEQAGRLEHSLYVERASMPAERWAPVAEVDPDSVPYFSLVVVPGDGRHGRRDRSPQAPVARPDSAGTLLVVGIGPGADGWVTPEVSAALAHVDHLVGYEAYVDRVPHRPAQTRHVSGNTVELDRARIALDLACAGERVAVVSGGDAGVFGMAAAVYEAADDPRYADVDIQVLPGMTAVQAVAARAGAPIGADFAVLSLSDRLKPWAVVEKRLRSVAEADLVLAIYNPASRSRTEQVVQARKILLEHRSPDTVVVLGRNVGRDGESLTITTLGELDTSVVDMSTLLIVGASTTRRTARGEVWTPRFVEQ